MKIKKIIVFLLFITSLICVFSACNPEEAEITTEQTSAETEPPAPAELVLIENGATDFTIIRSENATGYYLDTATAVYQKLKEEYSQSFKISEDWINPLAPSPETAHEILLFSTNRAESVAAVSDLTFDGYIIRITDFKVVIVGSGISQCNAALSKFFDEVLPEHTKDGVTVLPVGLEIKEELENSPIDFKSAIAEGKKIGAHMTEVFHYSGKDGFSVSQGAATDGKYAYVAMKKKIDNTETDKIFKIDMATWEIVAESEELPLDHANDMTYDSVGKRLVVTNMYNNLISLIDAETLVLVEQKRLPYSTYATGYIEETDKYAFLSGGSLVIADSDFNSTRSSPLTSAPNYIGQGMDADSKYAYVPLSPNTGKNENIIQIYDIATGAYLDIAILQTKMESESIFHFGDNFFVNFNYIGSTIASLEFYIRFE